MPKVPICRAESVECLEATAGNTWENAYFLA